MTIEQIKALIAREYQQADASVQAFIQFLEGKDGQIKAAVALLEANGYVVTLKA
jgi:hypothetical protein